MSGGAEPTRVERPSIASLHLQSEFQGMPLANATGFVVERDGLKYLVTNFHVVTGRDPETHDNLDTMAAWPDSIRVLHHVAGHLGEWADRLEPLYDSAGVPRWLEHPDHRSRVDVVALPMSNLDDVDTYPYDPWAPPIVSIRPTGSLSIIGFPFGVSYGGSMAVWVQGFVASELGVDFGGLPRFLIDSRTRPGQSGSPVIFFNAGGGFIDAQGGLRLGGGATEEFVGVYSGRIDERSDLGFVWKSKAVREVIEGAVRGNIQGP